MSLTVGAVMKSSCTCRRLSVDVLHHGRISMGRGDPRVPSSAAVRRPSPRVALAVMADEPGVALTGEEAVAWRRRRPGDVRGALVGV